MKIRENKRNFCWEDFKNFDKMIITDTENINNTENNIPPVNSIILYPMKFELIKSCLTAISIIDIFVSNITDTTE